MAVDYILVQKSLNVCLVPLNLLFEAVYFSLQNKQMPLGASIDLMLPIERSGKGIRNDPQIDRVLTKLAAINAPSPNY